MPRQNGVTIASVRSVAGGGAARCRAADAHPELPP